MFNGLKSESCRRILLVTQATFDRPHNIVWNLQTAGHVFVTSAENDMHPQATD